MWGADIREWVPASERERHRTPVPGRRGFEIAHEALNSKVEPVEVAIDDLDPAALGTFDVVLFLGVLYHMRHPLRALEKVAALTDRLLIVESHALFLPGLEERAICEFYEGDELFGDTTNWWGPNAAALIGLIRAAGFRRAELVGTIGGPDSSKNEIQHYRAGAHGLR